MLDVKAIKNLPSTTTVAEIKKACPWPLFIIARALPDDTVMVERTEPLPFDDMGEGVRIITLHASAKGKKVRRFMPAERIDFPDITIDDVTEALIPFSFDLGDGHGDEVACADIYRAVHPHLSAERARKLGSNTFRSLMADSRNVTGMALLCAGLDRNRSPLGHGLNISRTRMRVINIARGAECLLHTRGIAWTAAITRLTEGIYLLRGASIERLPRATTVGEIRRACPYPLVIVSRALPDDMAMFEIEEPDFTSACGEGVNVITVNAGADIVRRFAPRLSASALWPRLSIEDIKQAMAPLVMDLGNGEEVAVSALNAALGGWRLLVTRGGRSRAQDVYSRAIRSALDNADAPSRVVSGAERAGSERQAIWPLHDYFGASAQGTTVMRLDDVATALADRDSNVSKAWGARFTLIEDEMTPPKQQPRLAAALAYCGVTLDQPEEETMAKQTSKTTQAPTPQSPACEAIRALVDEFGVVCPAAHNDAGRKARLKTEFARKRGETYEAMAKGAGVSIGYAVLMPKSRRVAVFYRDYPTPEQLGQLAADAGAETAEFNGVPVRVRDDVTPHASEQGKEPQHNEEVASDATLSIEDEARALRLRALHSQVDRLVLVEHQAHLVNSAAASVDAEAASLLAEWRAASEDERRLREAANRLSNRGDAEVGADIFAHIEAIGRNGLSVAEAARETERLSAAMLKLTEDRKSIHRTQGLIQNDVPGARAAIMETLAEPFGDIVARIKKQREENA